MGVISYVAFEWWGVGGTCQELADQPLVDFGLVLAIEGFKTEIGQFSVLCVVIVDGFERHQFGSRGEGEEGDDVFRNDVDGTSGVEHGVADVGGACRGVS